MKQLPLVFAIVSGLVTLAVADEKQHAILIQGSSSSIRIIRSVAADYAVKNKISVHIEESSSLKGIGCVLDGRCDLAISTIPLEKSEQAAQAKSKLDELVYGISAVTLILNPAAGVENLTPEQVKSLVEEKVGNWKEVGGADLPVVQFAREQSGVGPIAIFHDYEPKKAVMTKTSSEVINRVRLTKGGFAFTGLGAATEFEKRGELRIAKVNGVGPNSESVRTGKYPYVRNIYLDLRKGAQGDPELANFIEYLKQSRAKLFGKLGIVTP